MALPSTKMTNILLVHVDFIRQRYVLQGIIDFFVEN